MTTAEQLINEAIRAPDSYLARVASRFHGVHVTHPRYSKHYKGYKATFEFPNQQEASRFWDRVMLIDRSEPDIQFTMRVELSVGPGVHYIHVDW